MPEAELDECRSYLPVLDRTARQHASDNSRRNRQRSKPRRRNFENPITSRELRTTNLGAILSEQEGKTAARWQRVETPAIWHLTKRGTRVIIAHDDVQPVEITNPHLFKPKAVSGSQELQTATVAGKSISTAAATHGSLVSNAETPEATSLQVPSSAPAGGAPKKMVPISVFVSRKLSKLFVRQGFSPLFDVAVKIENPEEPLGTA
jgi:hypothetical protein